MIDTSWQTKNISELGDIVTGNTPSTKDPSNYGSDIPFIKPPELKSNLVSSAPEMLSKKGAKSARVLPPNSVMVSCIGNLGKVAINKVPVATNQQINSIIPNEGVDSKFLFYQVQSQGFRNQLSALSSATTVSIVNKGNFSKVEIPLPPLPTQHRIVEKIEELFSELDNGVENLKKAQKQLKTYRQTVLKDAFEGKLTKEWREQQDDLPTPEELLQQIKAERKAHRQREIAEWEMEVEQWEKDGKPGRKPRKPRKKSSQPPLNDEKLYGFVSLPEGWKWVQFDNVCEVKTNLVDPVDYKSYPHIAPNYIRKFTGQLLEYNSIEKDGVTSPKHLFYSGQIVYSKIRPYLSKLILAPFDGLCSADMYPIESNLNIKYLYYLMLSDVFLNQASTAGSRSVLPKINQKELGIIKLPMCSMIEQEEIVNQIESSISVIDQLEQTIQENLQKAEALRQSILKKAFSGELV